MTTARGSAAKPVLGALGALTLAIAPLDIAAAQATAVKPIRIVYPFPAGSAGDTVSRIIGASLQTQTGRTVLVENRSGAGGITGTRSMVGAEKDGSIFIVVPSAIMTMIPLYNTKTGYDPEKDFVALSHLVSQDLSVAVGPALPVTSLKELIEAVRKDPSKGTYGTPGAGSSLHLMGVKLADVANIKLVPVHYRGAAGALNDVVAGQLPMMFSPMPDQIQQHQAQRIRILATAGSKRSPFLDGVQTFKENGIDIVAQGWFGAFAPAGLPADIAQELGKQLNVAVNIPANKERLAEIGFMSVGDSGEAMRALVTHDINYWKPILVASGFKPE